MASISNNVTLALNVEQKQTNESNHELNNEEGSEFSTLYSQSMSSETVEKQTPKQHLQAEGTKSGNNSPLVNTESAQKDTIESSKEQSESSKEQSESHLTSVSELGNELASPELDSEMLNFKHDNLTDTIGQLLNQLHDSANATVAVNHFFNSAQLGDLLVESSDLQLEGEVELLDKSFALPHLSTAKQVLHGNGSDSSAVNLDESQSKDQVSDLLAGLKVKITELTSIQRQELSQQIDMAMDNLVGLAEEFGVDKQLLSDVFKQLQSLLSSEFIRAPLVDEGFIQGGSKLNAADSISPHKQSEIKVQTNAQLLSAQTLTQDANDTNNEQVLNASQVIEQNKEAKKTLNSSVVNVFNSQSNQTTAGQTSSSSVNAETADVSDAESQYNPKLQADMSSAGIAVQSSKDPKQLEQAFNALIDKMLAEKTNPDQVRVPGLVASSAGEEKAVDALGNLYSPASLNQLTQQRTQLMQATPIEAQLQQPLNILRTEAAKELHDRVTFMLGLNKKEAEIRLDPPELGSMQIRVRSDAEQAQINFVVQNQQAKEALEQSLPRLREMLAEQGIQLGESSIEQQNDSNHEDNESSGSSQNKQGADTDEEIEQTSHISARIAGSRVGGVDFYA